MKDFLWWLGFWLLIGVYGSLVGTWWAVIPIIVIVLYVSPTRDRGRVKEDIA